MRYLNIPLIRENKHGDVDDDAAALSKGEAYA